MWRVILGNVMIIAGSCGVGYAMAKPKLWPGLAGIGVFVIGSLLAFVP
jgi:hypothetical protein